MATTICVEPGPSGYHNKHKKLFPEIPHTGGDGTIGHSISHVLEITVSCGHENGLPIFHGSEGHVHACPGVEPRHLPTSENLISTHVSGPTEGGNVRIDASKPNLP